MTASIPIWSDDFLQVDIRDQPEYQALLDDPSDFDAFVATAREALNSMQGVHNPDEELTIARVIEPILNELGWDVRLRERSLTSRDEVDIALYADADQAERLLSETERDQVLGATGIVECKRWARDFDAAGGGGRGGETAAQQLQRYLLIAGADSNESVRWGLLTNGGRWRLYSYRARPRERLYQIDLAALLASTDLFSQVLAEVDTHRLRTAYLLLRRDSWLPTEGERESFLDRLLEQGRRRDADLADDLSDVIFKDVYPEIVRLFWKKQPGAQSEGIARAALLFLYRLLFIYYAEDRGMLNTEDPNFGPHSLRYSVRDPVASQRGSAKFSEVSTEYWRRLQTLRQIIDQGDASIGVPAYNGGLFAGSHAILDEIELSDAELAPIIYDLSHTSNGTYVSYRNLEVQQLGSIYERLLERVPRRDQDGQPDVAISPYARKDSGSYYTPQELVDLIVDQTLTPLIDERVEAFRTDPIKANDPAEAVLSLRVLDPAMGSAHFLITAIDWLAEQLVSLINSEWEQAPGYVSPVRERVWELQDTHPGLDDHTLLQRMVLKRCIYGVDKNPMAVELARVALWLHTFTGELPLPYLEHRIVEGDSLLGIRGEQARAYISEWGPYPLNESFSQDMHGGAVPARAADALIDLTMAEIRESEQRHDATRQQVFRHRNPLNLVAGLRWLSAGMKKRERADFHAPLAEVLNGHSGRAISILFNGENREGLTPTTFDYRTIRDEARAVARRERILHWEIEFPHVMLDGGFDAVIGNPPWDRIKLQEVEWWATRDPDVARARTAAERRQIIAERRAQGDPIVTQFDDAADQAAQLSTLVRKGGDYPLLGKGDINLYSLFVERSLSLLKPNGICGLLTPSGIYADKTAADFFRSISTTGRLGGIYDFENRRSANPDAKSAKWFPDVHPQFKFCATIIGGTEPTFEHAQCGFFLNSQAELQDDDRVFPLTPRDFARINPNTGTAPILRSRRDAEIVSRIYRNHPVLVDRSNNDEIDVYQLQYHRMLDMATDSHQFATAGDLEAAGAYKVRGNHFKRGEEEWLPLYQGRMIHHYDHRANSVGIQPDNVTNRFVSVGATDSEKSNPDFLPTTQFWVARSAIDDDLGYKPEWLLGFRNITRVTDERTRIGTIGPEAGYGHSIPLLLTQNATQALLFVSQFNSIPLDYIARCKMPGTNMTWYIVEQLPMIHPDDFERSFGGTTARELVRDLVLRLTYTAHDLTPFARDLGYEGEPFIWDPKERRQLQARLDALFFHLYGLSEDDADYILDQFPVLEKNERREFGHYLTKHLVLNHYRALAAGDTDAVISESGYDENI
ncbi:MAG: N-6 DNA methylase [Chloroflexi bacterium]|nr:N-6 DNA methylase [Chloroflexota bacterium]